MRLFACFFALLSAVFLSSSAIAQDNKLSAGQANMVDAAILSVNSDTREISFPIEGRLYTVKVDDRVKNFDQIKVGDILRISYIQAVAVGMAPADSGRSSTSTAVLPTLATSIGGNPSAVTSKTITVVARIESLNAKKQIVTIQGPDSKYVDVYVESRDIFNKLKAGDYVETTYNEAIIAELIKP